MIKQEDVNIGFLSGITSLVKEHPAIIHGVLDVTDLSLASTFPGIGDTIALAKKPGKALKGLKGLKDLKGFNALDKAKGMKSLFGAFKDKAKTRASKVRGWLKNPKEAFNNIKKRFKGECVNGRCFTGNTLVYTRHGYKTIKEIQKGDEVYSRNAETGETGFKEVEEIFCTTAHTIYHVWIDGKEEIKTTAYHPVYVEGQGWVTAINLHEGDAIETMDGCAYITKIEKIRYEEPVPVYNFHVKEWASYFVGEVRAYVHNSRTKTHGEVKEVIKEFDIVNYSDKITGIENHHAVLDVWATNNIKGYKSRASKSTSIALTKEHHAMTKAVYRDWLFEKTGKKVGGKINWKNISLREIQSLSERMFDAANVPVSARKKYYNEFNSYIYNLK